MLYWVNESELWWRELKHGAWEFSGVTMKSNILSEEQINSLWNSPDDRIISRQEAAALLGINPASLANGLKGPELRSVRVGRLIRYRLGDLRSFLAAA